MMNDFKSPRVQQVLKHSYCTFSYRSSITIVCTQPMSKSTRTTTRHCIRLYVYMYISQGAKHE